MIFNEIWEDEASFISDITESTEHEGAAAAARTFNIIKRHYGKSDIRYDDADDFKDDFYNVYEDATAQFLQQTKLSDAYNALSPEDARLLNEAVNNLAVGNNEKLTDKNMIFDYVTTQQRSFGNRNAVEAYIVALNNIPQKFIRPYISQFSDLFAIVLSSVKVISANDDEYENPTIDWGNITGDIRMQEDLRIELQQKVNKTTFAEFEKEVTALNLKLDEESRIRSDEDERVAAAASDALIKERDKINTKFTGYLTEGETYLAIKEEIAHYHDGAPGGVDLSIYETVSGSNEKMHQAETNAKSHADTLATQKVDKVSGKQLSTNDFTNEDKAKLATIDNKVDKIAGKQLSTNDFTDQNVLELSNKQDKLIAGDNISIVGNTISSTSSGGANLKMYDINILGGINETVTNLTFPVGASFVSMQLGCISAQTGVTTIGLPRIITFNNLTIQVAAGVGFTFVQITTRTNGATGSVHITGIATDGTIKTANAYYQGYALNTGTIKITGQNGNCRLIGVASYL